MSGRFDDRAPSSPLSGILAVGPFIMPDAPRAARLARDATFYGWLLAPRSPALRIDAVSVPFAFADDRVTIHDASVHDAALGATARGTIDTANETLAIQGTLVPAWAINHLPGALPLVGHLFSPERNGGLFAATYAVSGPLRDPHVTVNPWSLLLPGALRRLLPP